MKRRYAAVDTATGETILTGTNPVHLLQAAREDWGAAGTVRIIELPPTALDEAARAVGADPDNNQPAAVQPDLFGGDAA